MCVQVNGGPEEATGPPELASRVEPPEVPVLGAELGSFSLALKDHAVSPAPP